jgi:hypothetical protein
MVKIDGFMRTVYTKRAQRRWDKKLNKKDQPKRLVIIKYGSGGGGGIRTLAGTCAPLTI